MHYFSHEHWKIRSKIYHCDRDYNHIFKAKPKANQYRDYNHIFKAKPKANQYRDYNHIFKAKHKVIQYRDYKKFVQRDFREELISKFENEVVVKYAKFEAIFLQSLDKHAPLKSKVLRANNKPYMTSTLRKAIMRRSALQNRYYRNRTLETEKA